MFSKTIIIGLIMALILPACVQAKATEISPTFPSTVTQVLIMTASPTHTPSATPTAQATLTHTSRPSATSTLSVTPYLTPSITLSPTLSSVPLGVRVFMPTDTTSTTIKGAVGGGGRVNYLLKAAADQVMMVMIQSANPDLVLEIRSPTGNVLVDSSARRSSWQDTLPASGDYVLTVIATAGAAEYAVDVTIPQRIIFKPGALSTLLKGFVPGRGVTTYLLSGVQGQSFAATIFSPRSNVFLSIYGLDDGQPYIRSVSGQTAYSFQLPSTQDYVIQCVSGTDISENYQMELIVR